MSDFILNAFSQYGVAALTWLLAALAALGVKYLWGRIGNEWARKVIDRAHEEIRAAVLEVAQTYADAL